VFVIDTFSVCISGSTSANILHAREVVQYHLTSGMDHVYLGFTMDYNNILKDSSPGTKRMESMLQDYIQEGKVCYVKCVMLIVNN
jgi:hypothetical protein